jgi:hypothetical protein
MIATCSLCGSDFLTEADPYIVRPTPQGVKLVCGCQINGLPQADKLFEELTKLCAALDESIKVIEFYATPESWVRGKNDGNMAINATDREYLNPCNYGGRRAREFLSKHKELIKGEV